MPVHPILFAIFPSLALFARNFSELTLNQLTLPLTSSFILGIVVFALISFFTREINKVAALTSVLVFLIFSYGHFIYAVKDIQVFENIANRSYLVFSIVIIFAIFMVLRKIEKSLNLKTLTIILNIISLSIIIFPLSQITYNQAIRISKIASPQPIMYEDDNKNSQSNLPDIYYIIVDRYARSTTLKEVFNFDNSDFLNFLEDRGFYVTKRSRSNYPFTVTSLASTLNMNYLDDIQSTMGKDSTDATPLHDMIENNEVVRYLKAKDYKYLHFGGEFGVTGRNKNADFNYIYWGDPWNLSEFERKFLNQTIYTPLISFMNNLTSFQIPKVESDRQRSYYFALDQLAQVAKTTQIEGPKFVFVHTFLTHDPFVFDKDGSYVPESLAKLKDPRQVYIDQVIFANRKLKGLIEALQSNSKSQPVIILQSDEGPYPERIAQNIDNFNWRDATKAELQQKFRITNNYYLPRVYYENLYPTITPVNTFRLIFNLYFGENFILLEDKNYAQVDSDHPYDVFEITNLLSK